MIDENDKKLRLVNWSELPTEQIHSVFPDAVLLGEMAVDFEAVDMDIYRFKDAAGNDQFAFDKGTGAVSHGSHILSQEQIGGLRKAGAYVGRS